MSRRTLPVSAVIATRKRAVVLRRTLASLRRQSVVPIEIIVVDASSDAGTRGVCENSVFDEECGIRWHAAASPGAASQRNEGVALAAQPFILFMDDDILFEPECLARMFLAMEENPKMGGVNATITNQQYHSPGTVSRLFYRLMHSRRELSYAGRVIGPGINFLPEDRADLPEVVGTEWLNTTCTLYRREALPVPAFPAQFTGYSMMEDLSLSLRVGQRGWTLANARTARIFHDSQPGDHKSDRAALARMELVNRHYVMAEVLGRRRLADYLRLGLLQAFNLAALLRTREFGALPAVLSGKLAALRQIAAARWKTPAAASLP